MDPSSCLPLDLVDLALGSNLKRLDIPDTDPAASVVASHDPVDRVGWELWEGGVMGEDNAPSAPTASRAPEERKQYDSLPVMPPQASPMTPEEAAAALADATAPKAPATR